MTPSTNESKNTFVINSPNIPETNPSLNKVKTTIWGGRIWMWAGIGVLGTLATGGVGIAIYGFVVSNTALGATGVVAGLTTGATGICFWRNMPDKDFENNVKDLTAQVTTLEKQIKLAQETQQNLNTKINELKRINEIAIKQFNEQESALTEVSSKLKSTEERLALTTKSLKDIEDLYTKYRQATEAVQQSLDAFTTLDPKLDEQIFKIKELIQTVGRGREETKQIVINVQSEASRTATQTVLLETQFNTINLSIRALLEPMRENLRQKALLEEQIESLRKNRIELIEEIAKMNSRNSYGETLTRAEETIGLLDTIAKLENQSGSISK